MCVEAGRGPETPSSCWRSYELKSRLQNKPFSSWTTWSRPVRHFLPSLPSPPQRAEAVRPAPPAAALATWKSGLQRRQGGVGRGAAAMALLEPLSAAQLRRLEQHRYSATSCSLLDQLLQHYWAWLVERTPLWLAPNTITLLGFVFNLLPSLLLIAYCPTATEEAPPWVFLSCALGLFVHQSLDAIDGKQARRTNSSSPLGELFDHGCDAVSAVFVGIGACIALRLGTNTDWLFVCSFIGMFLFYCAHWQTYVSGMLKFGKFDVTETQIAIMGLFLLTAFGGTTMWDTKIPVLDLSLKMIPVAGLLCGGIFYTSSYFSIIFRGGVGKNGSTIAGTSVLSPGLHIGLIITLAAMIYKKSTTHLFENHPFLYTLTFGFVNAKITQKLVIAHMTKSEIFLQDTAFIGPGLLFLDQYFNSFIDEYIILWIALIISLLDLLRYFTGLCIQIAAHFRIRVFKITSHPAPEQVQVVSPLSHQNNMD